MKKIPILIFEYLFSILLSSIFCRSVPFENKIVSASKQKVYSMETEDHILSPNINNSIKVTKIGENFKNQSVTSAIDLSNLDIGKNISAPQKEFAHSTDNIYTKSLQHNNTENTNKMEPLSLGLPIESTFISLPKKVDQSTQSHRISSEKVVYNASDRQSESSNINIKFPSKVESFNLKEKTLQMSTLPIQNSWPNINSKIGRIGIHDDTDSKVQNQHVSELLNGSQSLHYPEKIFESKESLNENKLKNKFDLHSDPEHYENFGKGQINNYQISDTPKDIISHQRANFINKSGEIYNDEDSHFFAYFLTMMVMVVLFYLLFHNKQRIIALMLEGRGQRNLRRSSRAKYHKLDNNLEEAMSSTRGLSGAFGNVY